MASKLAVTRLKYFLKQSLKFHKKLIYHVREDRVLMKGNQIQRDITNNLFELTSKFNLLTSSCIGGGGGGSKTMTILGDSSNTSYTVRSFISAVCINVFILAKSKT